jgi:diguanylate cyclase (GGDEF)-like protein
MPTFPQRPSIPSRWRAIEESGKPPCDSTPESPPLFLKIIFGVGGYLSRLSNRQVIALVTVAMAAIAALDSLSGEISFSVFYLIPISVATWRLGKRAGTLWAFFSAVLWGVVDVWGNGYSSPAIPVWNAAVRLGFFLIVTNALCALAVMQEWIRTDYLTGLANKRGFYEFAGYAILRSRRTALGFTLVYVDVDDFKSVNDKLGHSAGDALLQLLGTTLLQSIRRTDVVARIGGDEFAIFFSDTSFDSSEVALTKVRESLNSALSGHHWDITYSVGAATFQSWVKSLDAALDEADRLMYEVKRNGKKSVMHRVVAAPAMNQ